MTSDCCVQLVILVLCGLGDKLQLPNFPLSETPLPPTPVKHIAGSKAVPSSFLFWPKLLSCLQQSMQITVSSDTSSGKSSSKKCGTRGHPHIRS